MVLTSGSLNLLEPSWPVQGCTGIELPFFRFEPKFALHAQSNTVHVSHCKVTVADTESFRFNFYPEWLQIFSPMPTKYCLFFFLCRPSNWGPLKLRSECSCEISALRAFINMDDLTNSNKANYGSPGFCWLGSARGSTSTGDLPSRIALLIFKTKKEQPVQKATISASRAAEPAMWTHLYALF
jgi:hypothetical protein